MPAQLDEEELRTGAAALRSIASPHWPSARLAVVNA
jgi:hypothetical protein